MFQGADDVERRVQEHPMKAQPHAPVLATEREQDRTVVGQHETQGLAGGLRECGFERERIPPRSVAERNLELPNGAHGMNEVRMAQPRPVVKPRPVRFPAARRRT